MCGLQLCWYLIKYSGLRCFLIFGHPSDTAFFCLFLVPLHVVFIDRLWIVHYWASVNSTSFLQLFYSSVVNFSVCMCVCSGLLPFASTSLSSWSSETCSVMQKGDRCTWVCQWNLCVQQLGAVSWFLASQGQMCELQAAGRRWVVHKSLDRAPLNLISKAVLTSLSNRISSYWHACGPCCVVANVLCRPRHYIPLR